MNDFIYPVLATICLVPLSNDQWTILSSKCLILMKRLRLVNIQNSYSEFLECLLVQFLLSHSQPIYHSMSLQGALHGLKSSELSTHKLGESSIEVDLNRETDEENVCEEMIWNRSARMKQLFELLNHSFQIPSALIKKWGEIAGTLCRTCFTFCCHHLSMIPLYFFSHSFHCS